MSFEQFKHIIDTIEKLNIQISHITLSGMGEPLTDINLFEKAKYAKKLGSVETYTNGKAITKDNIYKIKDGFDRVYLSIHGDTPQEYENYTGNKFNTISKTAKLANEVLGNKLIISNHPAGKLSKYLGDKANTPASNHPMFNWGDEDIKEQIGTDMMHQKYCELINGIVFRVDGSIGTCCSDWDNVNDFVNEDFSYCMKCSNKDIYQKSKENGNLLTKTRLIKKLNEVLKNGPINN